MTSCLSDSCNIRWTQRSDGSRVAELYHPDAPKRVTPANICTGFYEDQNGCTSVLPAPFSVCVADSFSTPVTKVVTAPFSETVGVRVSVTVTNTTCYTVRPKVEHFWGNMEFQAPNGSVWSFTRTSSSLTEPSTCHYTPESFTPNSALTIPFAGSSTLARAEAIRVAYRDLLNRDPDDAGLQYWLGEIAAGNIPDVAGLRLLIRENNETITNPGDPRCYDLVSWPGTRELMAPGQTETFWTQLDWAASATVGESGTMTLRNGLAVIVNLQPVAPDGFGTCC